ncbi:hypothetical protein [Roseixanthobacter glucoisosaccharinicivorans]|uniref:hypothetical protein n=1 Tax=Roseixanthobacter glucoisosaccharinicivorans TaxID=3119923 RepID=UPI00372632D8
MPTNDFLPFATGVGANVMSQADYVALGSRSAGFVAGTAFSAPFNKAMRQASVAAAMIAQFGLDMTSADMLDDGDVSTILDIYKAAIRSQRLNYFVAGGTANALTITASPAPAGWSDLQNVPLDIRISATNTASDPTIEFSGVTGSKVLKHRDGSTITRGDLVSGTVQRVRYDGSVVRLEAVVASEYVSAADASTLWVRPDGSDVNDGQSNTAGGALQTINEAVQRAFRISGTTTIRLGVASTYAAWDPIVSGRITILGDVANQDNYIVAGLGPLGGGGNVFSNSSGTLILQGLSLHNTGPSNNTFNCNGSGYSAIDHVSFTAASSSIYSHICSAESSMIYVGDGCKVSGTMASALLARIGGSIVQTANLAAAPSAVFTAFAKAGDLGTITAIPGASISGSNTGSRYDVTNNSVINTYGAGSSFYPGTTSGTSSAGGLYV